MVPKLLLHFFWLTLYFIWNSPFSIIRLRGNCTPNQNLACFVDDLKIMNRFWKNHMINLKQIVWEAQKWHCNLSKPSSFSIIDQTYKLLFWSVMQEPLGLELLGQFASNNHIVFQKFADHFEIVQKNMLNFCLGCTCPLESTFCIYNNGLFQKLEAPP